MSYNSRSQRHLVIFVKAPQVGRVKTRLARDIGLVAAWVWYRRQAQDVIRRLSRDRRWQTHLYVTPYDVACQGRFWPRDLPCHDQRRGDLGQRMARPIRDLTPGPVVIIGSDVPHITPELIAAAFKTLAQKDVVFGPAMDGGFWLYGQARRKPHRILTPVRWSTEHALQDSLACLPEGLRVGFVARLRDVDTAADLGVV